VENGTGGGSKGEETEIIAAADLLDLQNGLAALARFEGKINGGVGKFRNRVGWEEM
jgi:hypothetical protein